MDAIENEHLREIQSVMDVHTNLEITYRQIRISRKGIVLEIPYPYELEITPKLFGDVYCHILKEVYRLHERIYDPNNWPESDSRCPKGESYRERHYLDIDYLTYNYGTEGQMTSHMYAGDVLEGHKQNLEADLLSTGKFKELKKHYLHKLKISEEVNNGGKD